MAVLPAPKPQKACRKVKNGSFARTTATCPWALINERKKMKLVFASDSFKGSLSYKTIAELLTKAAKEVLGECETICVPLADGGEGTAEALISICKGSRKYVTVHDPLGRPVRAFYGVLPDGGVICEMAQASGLTLLDEKERDPRKTDSFGSGEIVKDALKRGYRKITIAIGGSATNDGGMGFCRALGVRFLDAEGCELKGCGADLCKVSKIDTSNILPELKNAYLSVMCDVDNPLCGKNGATYTFGAQKGGTPGILDELEAGMQNYRDVIIRQFGTDPDMQKGGGAAGGLGTALKVFFGAEIKSGVDTVLDLADFEKLITGADLVVTGEGRLDWQSFHGKAVSGVAKRAKKAAVPCMVICGCVGEGYEAAGQLGISRVVTLADEEISPDEAMSNAESIYFRKALEAFEEIKKERG